MSLSAASYTARNAWSGALATAHGQMRGVSATWYGRTVHTVLYGLESIPLAGRVVALVEVLIAKIVLFINGVFVAVALWWKPPAPPPPAPVAAPPAAPVAPPLPLPDAPWDFVLPNPNGQPGPVKEVVSYRGQQLTVALRPTGKPGSRDYCIFVNDRPIVLSSHPGLHERHKPLNAQRWVLDRDHCYFATSHYGGPPVLHIARSLHQRQNNLWGSPSISLDDFLDAAAPYYEVFSARSDVMGRQQFLAVNPLEQQEAEEAAAPHLQTADLAACHLKTGLVACIHFKTLFVFQAAPEGHLRRVVPPNAGLLLCLSREEINSQIGNTAIAYEVHVCGGYAFDVELQVEPDRALTVWFNHSPGQFLPGSKVQADTYQRLANEIFSCLSAPLPAQNHILPRELSAVVVDYSFPIETWLTSSLSWWRPPVEREPLSSDDDEGDSGHSSKVMGLSAS